MTYIPRHGHSPGSLAFTLTIPAIHGAVLVLFANRTGARDHDQFLVFHELQYWNASLFGLAKQWSPVMCSGLSLAGEPQVPFASATMLLADKGLRALAGSLFIGNGFFICRLSRPCGCFTG